MAHKSKETLNGLAKTAAQNYLSKKTPLNTSLKKLAKDEALEPHQVEYIAATANHAVWEQLYNKDKKASYDFPLADPSSVIQDLQIKTQPVIKEAAFDYLSGPQGSSGFVEKQASYGGEEDQEITRRRLKHELQVRFEKLSAAKSEFEAKKFELELKNHKAEVDFVKEARALVIQEPFSERGQAVETVGNFVKSACSDNTDLAKKLMLKLSHVLKKQGLIKEADLKAPEEYINDKIPAKIVNGRHALYITIQTLKDIEQEYGPACRGWEIVDSSLPELREKIRAL